MKTIKILLSIIIIGTILLLGSCATTYVNSARDTSKVSKALTKNELGATDFIVVPQSGEVVYKTIANYFYSKNSESVVRYKYNARLKQYHTNDWIFLIAPPNNMKGAYVLSKNDVMSSKQRLVMVYVDPTNPDGTEIKVTTQFKKAGPSAKESLTQILNRLPSIDKTSPESEPTPDTIPDADTDTAN